MSKNAALMIAGIIFGIVSILHLLRLFFVMEVVVASYVVPMWFSWLGFIVAFILCVLMFRARTISLPTSQNFS